MMIELILFSCQFSFKTVVTFDWNRKLMSTSRSKHIILSMYNVQKWNIVVPLKMSPIKEHFNNQFYHRSLWQRNTATFPLHSIRFIDEWNPRGVPFARISTFNYSAKSNDQLFPHWPQNNFEANKSDLDS